MKGIFLLACLVYSLNIFAQSNNVQSAADAFKDLKYTKNRFHDLNEGKKYIDLAAENPQTSNDPKMWYYRGMIYLQIDQDTSEAARNLDPDAIEKSALSFINCIKTDLKKNYSDECNNNIWVAGVRLYNKAVASLNKGDFERATRYFKTTADIIPYDKDNNLKRNTITPDIIHYNLAKTALRQKDNAKAKEYLQALIDSKYNDPMIYVYMEQIYLDEKDTAKALTAIEQGRKIFEENTRLLGDEIRIYSAQGKIDVLIAKFTDAISINQDNEMLYYNRGTLYENKKDYKSAEADYKKAIELNENYLDANYGIGTMYFNQAAEVIKSTQNMKSNDDFEKAKKEYEGLFKSSEPYLEKAAELNPKKTDENKKMYKDTLNSLKQLYVRIGETEKYNKTKAQLEQL
jgi:tetratricopeptide (TPR) repeat protein